MPRSFLARLPLARSEVDRDYLGRDDSALLQHPDARFMVLSEGLALLETEDSLRLLTAADAPESDLVIYLGRSLRTGAPHFAIVLDEPGDLGPWGNLRSLGARLSESDAGLFTEALAVANWHAATRFSPLSGAATTVGKGGWVLIDNESGRELFPRTDMAIIVGVVDAADRLLLGSNAAWEHNRYSLLAGFVEPGESLEAAVAREIFEESGMRVTDAKYLGSQPWPFPASLMLGFTARVDDTVESVLTPDGQEILDLRWFTRAELHAAEASGEVKLPTSASIARAIIEEWYGGPLDVSPLDPQQ